MFVIYLENYSQSLRGKLKTYLYEIKPALYIGMTSAQTRDLIWSSMIECDNDVNAVLIYQDKTEQGFSVRVHGETKRKIVDFGGLYTVTYGDCLSLNTLKSKDSAKPLICHFYETACTADCLMDGYLKNLLANLSNVIGENEKNVKSIILFFAFLHDIGKIHPAFQFKLIPDVLSDFGYENKMTYDGFRHEIYSEKILNEYIVDRFGKLHSRNLISIMPRVVKCHHQGKVQVSCPLPEDNKSEWITMQNDVISIAATLFPFNVPTRPLKELGNGVFELLVGIINLADWMASTQNVFDDKVPSDFIDISEYVEHLKTQCNEFLNKNFMDGTSLHDRFHNLDDFWSLLIPGFSPRPMQNTVGSLIDDCNEPSLLFIEDSCGGGKTEAAMYYALSQAKNANGIYFALPTTATSENMRSRIADICARGISSDFKVPVYNSMAWMQDDDVRLDTNLWQNDTKLKLFYPISVGTVDQLLMTIQGIKYSDLGLIALSNKVLIIDEMHAYDAYMLEELKTLFSYCSLMGVTIVVLSATMTSDTKKQLISAYNIAKNTDKICVNGYETFYKDVILSQHYPLITKATKTHISEIESPISKNTVYEYDLLTLKQEDYFRTIWEKANSLICEGGTLAIVFNTVQQVIDMYLYASQNCSRLGLDIDLNLLHSRFSLTAKAEKTKEILTKYGKDRTHRPKRSVLISTQIIEQSLDVDFDYMITEIAPIDLIEQRFGRIRRHSDIGTIREIKTMQGPSAFIFCFENGFGKSAYVYDESILKATKGFLIKGHSISSPGDVRESIESVYLPENINQLKAIRQAQKADTISIGKVNCDSFWRVNNLTSLRNDPHTRQETLPSTNIILINEEQRKTLESGGVLSSEEFKEMIKTQMYSSVPIHKIDNITRIETNGQYLDEYYVFEESQFQVSSELGLQI